MKFLDKVKNMFTEVVEEEPKNDEVVVEQIVTKKEKNIDTEEIKESKIPEPKKEEKKPIFFTDDDFNDLDDYFNKNSSNKKSEPVMEEKSRKDLSDISRYLTKLKDYQDLAQENPIDENISMYKKYFNLYREEYKRLFNEEPRGLKMINFRDNSNER